MVAIALSIASWWLGIEPGPGLRYGPLLASLVLLGLPHGAVDHLVPARFTAMSFPLSIGAVGLTYSVFGGLYLGLWLVAPRPAAIVFIALTWLHWGQGDLHALLAFLEAPHLTTRAQRVSTLVVRGGLPMLVPLVAFPERYLGVVEAWVALFFGEMGLAWTLTAEFRLLLGGGFLFVTVASLTAGYYTHGPTHGFRVDVGETLLLWVYFLVVPPLVAIGVYFTVWHSLRHIFRVVDSEGVGESAGTLFRRFATDATPLTLVSMVLLAGFWVLVPASPTTVSGLVALYLVFIAVLTLPHVVVVTWMDAHQGVWKPRISSTQATGQATPSSPKTD